jgi:hypothetical protein
MVLTDWPGEQLAHFWADHSILATVVSSLLLLSVGYLAFEAGDNANQAELNRSVTSAGLSGLVDHLVDVDIALSMISNEHAPAEFTTQGRPLRWIRPIREGLQDGIPPVALTGEADGRYVTDWRQDVMDQCIRRIMVGMRDWAALITVSSDGRQVLKRFGEVRLELLQLYDGLGSHNLDEFEARLRDSRKRLQRFAIGLEHVSSLDHPRPGLTNFVIGGLSSSEVEVTVGRLKNLSPPTVGALVSLLDKLDGQTG